MKRKILILIFILIGVGLFWAAWMYWQELRGVGPAILPPPENISDLMNKDVGLVVGGGDLELSKNNTKFPLSLPDNFEISILADNIPGARVLELDAQGNLWVSQTKEGKISKVDLSKSQPEVETVLTNLRSPHSLAFDPEDSNSLYVAEEHRIFKVNLLDDFSIQKIIDLPTGGRHTTRTIGFGPDGRLYISLGSSCDTCYEDDERRAAFYSLKKDGSDFVKYADGLRNSVFFDWSPVSGKIWATEMGRDFLGDDFPPDEINIIEKENNYGWPLCYGKNVHDSQFDKNKYIQNPCFDKEPSFIDLPAHSAPLGIAFVPSEGWPDDWQYDIIVAYHGSWNRSDPTGYKLARLKLDALGRFLGEVDFISGWLVDGGALDRPVDVLIQSDGIMYVSDDKAGVIYQIKYQK